MLAMYSQKRSGMLIGLGAFLALIAVALGAFGVHGLETVVTQDRLDTWATAVQYHYMHVVALILIGMLMQLRPSRGLFAASLCFLAGIALFSGSLYLLVLLDMGALGMITPLGGLLFLAGWLILGVGQMRVGNNKND